MKLFRKTYYRAVIALMVMFSTIAPACAIGLIPSAMANTTAEITTIGTLATKVSSSHKAHLPCHKAVQNQIPKQKKHVKSDQQSLCFQHCLQSLNDPCLTTTEPEFIEVRDTQLNYKFTIARLLNLLPSQFEMISGTDPPYIISALPHRTGLSALITTTSRIRF